MYNLYTNWIDKLPIRAGDALDLEVRRIHQEISAGKTDNIAERFSQAKEMAIAAFPNVTFPETLNALGELAEISRTWYDATPHSEQELASQLRKLCTLLEEIAAGQIENVPARFEGIPE